MNGRQGFWWVALVAAVMVVLAACTGSGSGQAGKRPRATPTASVPADEQAANGPLVGDPSLVAGEQSCAAAEANPPWYPTIAAFEVHDAGRTHLYDCAHFTGSMSGANQVFAYSSPQDYITPYNIVDHGPNELFIYGGGYGDNPAASGSFVARVEPGTFNPRP
jgi:Tfp pilus assembly protein PilX